MAQPIAHDVTPTPTMALDNAESKMYLVQYRTSVPGGSCKVRVVPSTPPASHPGYFTVLSSWAQGVKLNKRSNDRFWVWGDDGGTLVVHEAEVE